MIMRVLASPGLGARESNPYTWLLYSRLACRVEDFSYSRAAWKSYEVVHFHWPEAPLNSTLTEFRAKASVLRDLMLIEGLRSRGSKVFWTVHNLGAHEGRYPTLEPWFWDCFTAKLDAFIALTQTGLVAARNRFPRLRHTPGFVIPHGHYRDEYPARPRTDCRRALNLPSHAKVILFFGQIRAYKNILGLISEFRAIRDESTFLVIAGESLSDDLSRQICQEGRSDTRIRLSLGHVPKDRVSTYFGAADLVALPYHEILNSGTALLALSLNRPVLVPLRGAMGELAQEVGQEWVRPFLGELTVSALKDALTWALETPRSFEAPLDHLDWNGLAQRTLAAYEAILAGPVIGGPRPFLEDRVCTILA
ncbi:MAG: glycosyltransferase [Terriglobia bacterium]